MKKAIWVQLSLAILIISQVVIAQNYTWIKGRDTINKRGNYGLVTVTSTSANPGGRSGSAHWKDNSGNFWLLGGDGFDRIGNQGLLSDLWKYQPSNNSWTWMKGDDTFLQGGHYGTLGVPNATVWPGGRTEAATWKDNAGNLWLFGGFGYASTSAQGHLSDLWKFDISTNQWTWVNGSNNVNQNGTYGVIGSSAPGNAPGAREGAITWIDATNKVWLFGGYGYSSSTIGYLNDLWSYNMQTNEWTWVSGGNGANANGVYGTLNVTSPSNSPGARAWQSGWIDQTGIFWLFGGEGYDGSSAFFGMLNDLWTYNSTTNEWTWVKGSNQVNQNGSYGTQGITAPANAPGARKKAISWVDVANNFWLSAGEGYPITGSFGLMQDLWKYTTSSGNWTWMKGGGVTNIPGVYGTIGIASAANVLGSRSAACSWLDGNNNLWLFGGFGRATLSYTANGSLNDLWRYNNCFVSPETLTITAKDSLICPGETTSLTVVGGSNYSWNTGSITPYIVINPSISTSYTVTSTTTNNCMYSSSFTQSVDACAMLNSYEWSNSVRLFPNPSNGHFTVEVNSAKDTFFELSNSLGQVVLEKRLMSQSNTLNNELASGVYIYVVRQNQTIIQTGKLIIRD